MARPPVEVTLRHPPPLEVDLDVRADRRQALTTLGFGGAVIAEARAAELTGALVDPVDLAAAQAAMEHVRRLGRATRSPAASCAAPTGRRRTASGCDPAGCADRTDTVATAWVPDASVADADGELPAAMVWAALDCPGGWSGDLAGRPMVLGRITAEVDALPAVGDPCVVRRPAAARRGPQDVHRQHGVRRRRPGARPRRGDLDRAADTRHVRALRHPRLMRCDRPDQDVRVAVHGREVVRTLEYLSDA